IWMLLQVKVFIHCTVVRLFTCTGQGFIACRLEYIVFWFLIKSFPYAYLSYDLFHANLTPLGWSQVDNLRKHVKTSDVSKGIELVIVSPLLRTMQTAVGVFGGEAYTDGITAPPLMNDNVGDIEQCREHLGVHPCDKRRSITEYRNIYLLAIAILSSLYNGGILFLKVKGKQLLQPRMAAIIDFAGDQ
ncbi:hypothetical protein S245_040984, partial [Arachis hypogaea]